MNAEAERHLKALDSLIAIHHADTGQEAVKALAGIIRNLETEAAERNKTQAEYFDKLCKVTGSPSHDLDELVKDVRALKSAKEMIETYRDDWRAQSRAKDAENERLTKQLAEAQQQSQPQPPNSYLAKEIDRLEAEAGQYRTRILELEAALAEREAMRNAMRNHPFAPQVDQPLPCHTLQTHQSDPAVEISRMEAELSEKNAMIARLTNEDDYRVNQVNALLEDLRAARDEANSLRAERDRYAKIIDRL